MISSKVMHRVDQIIRLEEVKEMITLPSMEMILIAGMTSLVMEAMISSKVALDRMIFKVDLAMMK